MKHISSSGRKASRLGLWELYGPDAGSKTVFAGTEFKQIINTGKGNPTLLVGI